MLFDQYSGEGLLVVVAHPDDETIGAGGHIPLWPHAHYVTVTTGAPKNDTFACNAGVKPADYARLRWEEFVAALSIAGIDHSHCECLGFTDQEAPYKLIQIAEALAELFSYRKIKWVLTHPYEGGHADHDAVAFAVHAASAITHSPSVYEFTSYHAHNGVLRAGVFRKDHAAPEWCVKLSQRQREIKEYMLACYRSQPWACEIANRTEERFRLAPAYDYSVPPPEPFYEQMGWNMTAAEWRELAAAALARMPHFLSR